MQELMAAGLLGASMAQPIDDCLIVLGRLMFAGPLQSAVMTSSWQPTDLLGKSGGGEAKNVLQSILQVMGLTVAEVNDADTLSRLGIDSMQLVEVPLPFPLPLPPTALTPCMQCCWRDFCPYMLVLLAAICTILY